MIVTRLKQIPLQVRILVLIVFIIITVLLISGISFYRILHQTVEETVGKNALEITRVLAELPLVHEALQTGPAHTELQQVYERYLHKTNGEIFLVLIDQNGIRYTHPNKDLIGLKITGNDSHRAIQGESYYSKAQGISGPTLRSFVPVIDPETNRQIGVIIIGFYQQNVLHFVKENLDSILLWLGIALLIGIAASLLLSQSIKKSLHGYEPDEIAKLFRENEAILASLDEGIIAMDQNHHITAINQAAARILDSSDHLIGKHVTNLIPDSVFSRLMQNYSPGEAMELFINHISILASYHPIVDKEGKHSGTVITFRDITEVRNMAEELTGVQQYIDGLRAKSHEFINKLQTISGLIELKQYKEVQEYIVSTTSKQQDLLHFFKRNIEEPKVSGLLLGKVHQAEELNISISFAPGSSLRKLPPHIPVESVVLILGNLLQNAIDAVKQKKTAEIQVTLLDEEHQLTIVVEDNGTGIPEEFKEDIFRKGFSTKGKTNGYGLYLVKYHLEDILGGQIFYTSSVESGTAFVAIIPKTRTLSGRDHQEKIV